MSRLARGVALVLLLCITLLVSAPARLLHLVLPAEQVQMQGFDGTVWRGSASRCLVRAGPGYMHLGAVQWSLDPMSLLLLAPRLTFSSAWAGQTIAGDLVLRGRQDVQLRDFEAVLSADVLRQFIPVSLTGTLSAQLHHLQVRAGLPYSGSGRLVWQEGGWKSARGALPLGSYALDFEQVPGEELLAEVLTLSGPVEAGGLVQLDGRKYTVDVLVSSDFSLDAELEQALSLVAVPGPQGYRVKLDGEL